MMDIMYAEILNGIKVKMSRPKLNHIKATGNIHHYLYSQFREKYVIIIEPNLYIGEKDLFFPDLVICREEIVKEDGIYEPPELIIEILSPSTHNKDKQYKFHKYFDFGVKEYWLVEPNSGIVDIYADRELWDTFRYVTESDYKMLSDDQKEDIKTHVKSNVFPDLELKLEDVFYKVKII